MTQNQNEVICNPVVVGESPQYLSWEPVEPWDAPRLPVDTLNLLYGHREPRPNEDLQAMKRDVLGKVRADPWYWLKNFVITKDEIDRDEPFKPFPVYYFLFLLVKAYMSLRLVSVKKSRQMMVSWLFTCLKGWDVLYHQGSHQLILSTSKDTANNLLDDRLRFVYEQLPPFLGPELAGKEAFKESEFKVRSMSSMIECLPQGTEKARSFTGELFFDEAGFQENFEAVYGAASPILSEKGRCLLVSTASKSFWERLHEDNLRKYDKNTADDDVGVEYVLIQRLGRNSVTIKRLHNGFYAMWVHWSAHPERDEAWGEKMRSQMTHAQWMREYEGDSGAVSGQVIFDCYSPEVHVLAPGFPTPPLVSWYGGFDHGRRNPAAFLWIAIDPDNDAYVMDEYYVGNRIIADNARAIMNQNNGRNLEIIYGDPSTKRRLDNQERTFIEEYAMNGLVITPSINDMGVGIDAIYERLRSSLAWWSVNNGKIHEFFVSMGITELEQLRYMPDHPRYPGKYYWETPALYISPACTNLISEMSRWMWRKHNPALERGSPEKPVDKDDHAIDALRYCLVQYPQYRGISTSQFIPARMETAYHAARMLLLAQGNYEDEEILHVKTVELMSNGF